MTDEPDKAPGGFRSLEVARWKPVVLIRVIANTQLAVVRAHAREEGAGSVTRETSSGFPKKPEGPLVGNTASVTSALSHS